MIVFSISGDEDTCQNSNFDTTELDHDSGMYFDHLFRIYFFFFFRKRSSAYFYKNICLCSCTTYAENKGYGNYFLESGEDILFL